MKTKHTLLSRTPFVAGLFIVVIAPLFAAAETPPLPAAEIKSLLSGNSMAGNGKVNDPADPYDWIMHYATDGTFTMRLKPEWGGGISTGEWWVSDEGELCNKFIKPPPGKESCWTFHREDNFYRFIPAKGKAVEGRAAILDGNLLEK